MKKTDFWEPTFFQHAWLGLLQVVYLHKMSQLRFTHDGAPPSALLAVPKFMNNVFMEQWIAQSKPKARPDRCADLNSLEFYLWGHPKSTVCATKVSNVQDLQHWMQNGVEMIRTTRGIFPASQAVTDQTCIDLRWSERALWAFNLQEAVTRKSCFRRSVFIRHFISFIVA